MDHMDIYPYVVDLVNDYVAHKRAFTAYGLFQDLKTLNEFEDAPDSVYDGYIRASVHTAMVPHLRNGYDKRLKDFGGRWNAWEYYDPSAPAQRSVELFAVDSSAIASIGYDVDNGDLWVEFNESGLYKFKNVASPVFVDFLYADSKGMFFNDHIKHRYNSEKM